MSVTEDATPADAARDNPAANGPEWTGQRLRWALPLLYGTNRRGTTDVGAVASGLGVSRSTVYRWIAAPDAAIPPGRARQILQAALPDPVTLRRERQAFDYAVDAIDAIALPPHRKATKPEWRDQLWLEPHLVTTLDLDLVQLLQLATTRISGRGVADLQRRAAFADYTTVPTRFHATVLIQSILDDIRPWRIQARALSIGVGPTRTWSSDAPSVLLSGRLASLLEWLDRPASTRGVRPQGTLEWAQ